MTRSPNPARAAHLVRIAMLIIKNGSEGASIGNLAKAIEATGIVPDKKINRIKTMVRYMVLSSERFGEVDIENKQQVALVAYRIVGGKAIDQPNNPKKAKQLIHHQRQRRPLTPDIYELAIIGAGTTTAYYLDTMGHAYDHSTTVVIGKENPWINQRGHGISYINHTQRQIAMPSVNYTQYGGNESFANRAKFGRAAEALIAHFVKRWVKEM